MASAARLIGSGLIPNTELQMVASAHITHGLLSSPGRREPQERSVF